MFKSTVMNKSNVYRNIRKIRELKNLTREYVADEVEMSMSGYGKIERGEVDLTVSKLIKISKALDVSIEFLLKFDTTIFFNDSK